MSLLTRRFPTILGLLLLLAGIAGSIYYFRVVAPKTAPGVTPEKVRITNIADNKFSVSWVTQSATGGSVEYGAVGEKLTNIAKDERDTNTTGEYLTHHVTVEGLQPNTPYAFRILAGTANPRRFDNNGSPYTTTTGSVIGATPVSQNFYGNVQLSSKVPANGAIVYLTLPGGATASTLVRESGNYAFTLSTLRSSDLRSFVKFDPSATIANVTVEAGNQQAVSAVSLTNSAPVPTITLGQNTDFLNAPQAPNVAQVTPTQGTASASTTPAGIFNVEPLTGQAAANAAAVGVVTIINPKDEGETLNTLRPEFRGTGPSGTTLSIAITGQKAISDTITIASDGTWTWTPVIDLKIGKQTITVSYLPTGGSTQKVARSFSVAKSIAGSDPAFVASPSASTKATASSKPASSSGTTRTTMPATDSAVPVTGVIENTLLTGGLGIVIMVIGAALLSL